MKKRNQLVSALLTSVLLGGTATASVATSQLDAAAEESSQAETDQTSEEEAAKKAAAEKEAAERAAAEKAAAEKAAAEQAAAEKAAAEKAAAEQAAAEKAAAEKAAAEQAAAEQAAAEKAEAESAAEQETSDQEGQSGDNTEGGSDEGETAASGAEGEGSGVEEQGTESGASGQDAAKSGTEENGDQNAAPDDGTQEEGSGEGSDAADADSPAAETEDGKEPSADDNDNKEDASGEDKGTEEDSSESADETGTDKEEESAEKKETDGTESAGGNEEPAQVIAAPAIDITYKTPEQLTAEELAEKIASRKAEEIEKKRKEIKKTRQAGQEAAKKAAEAEKAAAEARRYSYAGFSRAYYTGNYFVTNAQKRLALNVGFTTIGKIPAMAADGSAVNILESKSDTARVLGILDGKDICYLLADQDDGSDWVYVESGEVRGFARMSSLKSDPEVSTYVNKAGDSGITTAEQLVDPLENTAYRYSLNTTKDVVSIIQALGTASVNRQAMISFGEQFVGNPYVWGGESLTKGCDCSGFTQQVYAQFGISLPRTSYEQAEVGVKIPAEEALPGDLLFYARDGVVYHVLMYVGDGKAVNASSSATGIIVQDVDYKKVCWACRYISDTGASVSTQQMSSTQASALQAIGQMAYEGDAAAQQAIIEALAQASLKEWNTYGFCRSVIIAQAIDESGWLSFGSSAAGIQSTDNNILGMNEDLNNSTWASPWGGKAATRLVPQYAGGGDVYNFESMRLYDDMESCMEDYAAFKVGLHPDLIGETDIDHVIAVGLKGYATNPNYQSDIRALIDRYDLTRYDQEETAAVRPESVPEEDETETAADETVETAAEETFETAVDETETATDETSETAADETSETLADETAETAADETAESTDELSAIEAVADLPDDDKTETSDPGEIAAEAVVVPAELEDEHPEADETESPTDHPAPPEDAEDPGEESDTADIAVSEEKPLDPAEDTAETHVEPPETAPAAAGGVRLDTTDYTEAQMEVIWAVVAQEDDTSYDGALAVISSVMNRADVNYGGFGTTAFDQLTAESQYAYSADVEDPLYYERRLGGNVPDFVKQAVSDCLTDGIRNNSYTSFRTADYVAGSVQIGANYYFYETAANASEAIDNMADVIGEIAEEIPDENAPTYVDEVVPEEIPEDYSIEIPDAGYLPSGYEDLPEGEEVEIVSAPDEDYYGEEYFGGIDENGYVVIDAIPDADLA